MADSPQLSRVYRFGPYEADVDDRQLRKHGLSVKLQDQPFEILALLLEHPGHLVTREQLRLRLWSAGTIVEFDHSVHTAVTKLREALGDDADSPRYIETVPRHGYRFVAPVIAQIAAGAPPPDHESPHPAAGTGQRPSSAAVSAFAYIAAVVVLLGGAFIAVDRFRNSRHSEAETAGAPAVNASIREAARAETKSVAVLPFVDLSEHKDQEFYSDGMAEEIIDRLAKVPALYVPARTSSFYFKGQSTRLADIARELGVAHLVEGSVRRSGSHLRVTATLVRADDGSHLWTATYDRRVGDVFNVQDEIAGAVATALKVSPLEDGARKAMTTSVDGYTLYLEGRALFNRGAPGDYHMAIDALTRALRLDPRNAPAWALLASAIDTEYALGRPHQLARVEARHAAEEALKLDPQLAEAHLALARLHQMEWQWDAADREIQQAMATEPGNPVAFRLASNGAWRRGQLVTALLLAEGARTRDPLDWMCYDLIAALDWYAGRLPAAEASLQRSLELNPLQADWHSRRADLLMSLGDPADALEEYRRAGDDEFHAGRILALDALARHGEADRELAREEHLFPRGTVAAFPIALVHAARGDRKEAFVWLDRAYVRHEVDLQHVDGHPFLKNLQSDARFAAFLRRLNAPEP